LTSECVTDRTRASLHTRGGSGLYHWERLWKIDDAHGAVPMRFRAGALHYARLAGDGLRITYQGGSGLPSSSRAGLLQLPMPGVDGYLDDYETQFRWLQKRPKRKRSDCWENRSSAAHGAQEYCTAAGEASLRDRLEKFSDEFDAAIDLRNKLIHAKPYTAPDRAQQLFYDGGPAWPIEDVYAAAKRFEAVALWAAENFWEDLVKARP